MYNNGSVMNGLHRISGKIAEASKLQIKPDSVHEPKKPESPPVLPPEEPDQSAAEKISSEVLPVRPVQETVSQKPEKTILADALLRRYDDFLKTRRDLASRITREITALRAEQELMLTRQKENQMLLEKLEQYAGSTNEADASPDPENQTLLAAECRKIEHIRLEMIRIAGRGSIRLDQENGTGQTASSAKNSILPELESLTFGQLARMGFALFFPAILAILSAAILIAAAVLLSLSGALAWG